MKNSRSLEIAADVLFHRANLSKSTLVAKVHIGNPSNVEIVRLRADGEVVLDETDPAIVPVQKNKFLVQDCQSHHYICCDSSWSDDIQNALDFLSARRAVLFGMKELKAEFYILEVGEAGTVATATIKMGLLKWSQTPPPPQRLLPHPVLSKSERC